MRSNHHSFSLVMSAFDPIDPVVINNEIVRLIGIPLSPNCPLESFSVLLEPPIISAYLVDLIGMTSFLGPTTCNHKSIIDMRFRKPQLDALILRDIPKGLITMQGVHKPRSYQIHKWYGF